MTSLRTFDALISCSCSVRLNATSVVHTCSYHSAGRRLLVPPNHIVGDHHQSNPVAHFGQSRCQRSSANHGDFYPCWKSIGDHMIFFVAREVCSHADGPPYQSIQERVFTCPVLHLAGKNRTPAMCRTQKHAVNCSQSLTVGV